MVYFTSSVALENISSVTERGGVPIGIRAIMCLSPLLSMQARRSSIEGICRNPTDSRCFDRKTPFHLGVNRKPGIVGGAVGCIGK